MKFAFKSFVTVAAFVAANAAHAQVGGFPPLLISGSGNWQLSNDALAAFGASGAVLRTLASTPSVPGVPGSGAVNTALYSKATGNLALKFSSVDTSGDAVSSLQAANSFFDIRRTTVIDDEETLVTRSVYLTNFDLNLSTATVYANLYSHNRTTGDVIAYGKLAIFTATVPGVVGGTQGNLVVDSVDGTGRPVVRASGALAGQLRINLNTADIMLASLGLSTGSDPLPTLWREGNWGTLSFTATSVPEPSSYALLGAGLLVAGLMSRRRAQAA